MRRRYRRKPDQAITAVQLDREFRSFSYRKWGHDQLAQPGDWLVDNAGDIYTVAADTFARTYREVAPCRWVKSVPVWAEQTAESGSVATK